MRYHLLHLQRDGKFVEYKRCHGKAMMDLTINTWKENSRHPHLSQHIRVEDMKTREVIYSSLDLKGEVMFVAQKGNLKLYKKLIHYWNKRSNPKEKNHLILLHEKKKRWERRARMAAMKLKSINASIKYYDRKLQVH